VEGHILLSSNLYLMLLSSCVLRSICETVFKGEIAVISVGESDGCNFEKYFNKTEPSNTRKMCCDIIVGTGLMSEICYIVGVTV